MTEISKPKLVLISNLNDEFANKSFSFSGNQEYEIVKTSSSRTWIDDVYAYNPDVIVLGVNENNYDEQISLLNQHKSVLKDADIKVMLVSSIYNFNGYKFESLEQNQNSYISDIIENNCSQETFIKRLDFVCNNSI